MTDGKNIRTGKRGEITKRNQEDECFKKRIETTARERREKTKMTMNNTGRGMT
jgi:hypothetical protein